MRLNSHTTTEAARWFALNMPPIRPEGLMRGGATHALREYVVRYRVVESVDGQGDVCPHCVERPIDANIYARTMDGDDDYGQACLRCVLSVLDTHTDVDPSFIVTVETCQ